MHILSAIESKYAGNNIRFIEMICNSVRIVAHATFVCRNFEENGDLMFYIIEVDGTGVQ